LTLPFFFDYELLTRDINKMRCPICGTEFDPAQSTARPFCSDRCRTIDLGRWLGEDYGLPHVPDPEADETPEADTEASADTNGDA
jgi:uncharacterized protein